MQIIGITGRKYHGKDTLAQHLVANGFVQMRFADPLKEMLRAFYRCLGVDADTIERKLEGDLKELPCPHLCGRTPRYAMQTLGTEWGRVLIGDDVWVQALRHRAVHAGNDVVVSDVRFGNECDTIKAISGRVVRVDASVRVPANALSNHASEQEIEQLPVDAVVDNNGPAIFLKAAAERLLGELRDVGSPGVQPAGSADACSQGSVRIF